MHDTVHIIIDITKDTARNVKYWLDSNIRNLPSLLNTALPYLMYFMGAKLRLNYIYLAIPIIVYLISYYSRSYANKINKGSSIPAPARRFTSEDEYGEVSINQDRLSELILYMADLEDFLERKGLL